VARIVVSLVEAYVFRRAEDGLRFLLLKRIVTSHYGGLWQGVAGHIQTGEKAWETALRELQEETGLSPQSIFVADHLNRFYDPHTDCVNLVPVFGIEVESSQVNLSDEHSEFRWVTFAQALELLTWNDQRHALRTVNEMVLANGEQIHRSMIAFDR